MRYELTDNEWTAIRPMLPNKPRGVPRVNDRRVLNGIFWILRSGAPWRDLPDDFGPYTTCYNRFVRWRRAGVWAKIMNVLAGAHDAAVQMIDTSIVRVHQHGACITRNRRQSMGRSRGAADKADEVSPREDNRGDDRCRLLGDLAKTYTGAARENPRGRRDAWPEHWINRHVALSSSAMVHRPLGMLAELTHRCPLGCPYCSNPLALDAREGELDTATWVRVFGEAAGLGVLQVHLSGGEPGARRDLVDITAGAHDEMASSLLRAWYVAP
jgi:transposase